MRHYIHKLEVYTLYPEHINGCSLGLQNKRNDRFSDETVVYVLKVQ